MRHSVAFKTFVGIALAGGVALVPSATGTAATVPRMAAASSPLCTGVSASQVSSIVGKTVPAATTTFEKDYFDKKLGIHEQDTLCTYGSPTSLASLSDVVDLSYEKLSKAPPRTQALADIKASFAKSEKDLPKGSKETYSVTDSHGIELLWMKITTVATVAGEPAFDFEGAFGWKGAKVAGAIVDGTLAQGKVEALEQLAAKNMGV